MAVIDFVLPQNWIDPKNPEHILLVAKKIEAIRYGDKRRVCPPEIQKDNSVHFPLTNDLWLLPYGMHSGQKEPCWRLFSRCDNEERLASVIKALQESDLKP